MPIRLIRSGCCARATSGDDTTAPPRSAMNPPLHSITSSARASSNGRNFEAERFCGLEVDHQLVLGRSLHRQVGRLLALEDAIDVASGASVLVEQIRPIADQAAAGDEKAGGVDRGQFVPGC